MVVNSGLVRDADCFGCVAVARSESFAAVGSDFSSDDSAFGFGFGDRSLDRVFSSEGGDRSSCLHCLKVDRVEVAFAFHRVSPVVVVCVADFQRRDNSLWQSQERRESG